MRRCSWSADFVYKLCHSTCDEQVRMNDEDIRKEYITQMEIILNDDPTVSEKVRHWPARAVEPRCCCRSACNVGTGRVVALLRI